MLGKALTTAAAGSAAGAAGGLGIEDVFSTWLYTGSGSTQTITNGIDLSGEGGLVWIKNRDGSYNHNLVDTERGYQQNLATNSTSAQFFDTLVGGFTSSGFVAQSPGSSHLVNYSNEDYASWTFRKAPGFFDVVTWTGDNTPNRAVSHSLGSTPGCIIVKQTSTSGQNWHVWHRSLNPAWTGGTTAGSTTGGNATGAIYLNSTAAFNSSPGVFTYVNSTAFGVYYSNLELNSSGETYVAYLFAHDEAIFGENADQSVIKCGSFTTDGSGNATVNLGWEPQWFLMKRTDTSESWTLLDTMRGFTLSNEQILRPNTSSSESNSSGYGYPTATGWSNVGDNSLFYSSADYIYIAIRRGPMKTPTDATEVFNDYAYSGSGTATYATGINQDALFVKSRASGSYEWNVFDKIRGKSAKLSTDKTAAEITNANYIEDWGNESIDLFNAFGFSSSSVPTGGYIGYFFRRAPGFFDMVAYTGNSTVRTIEHNLGVAPELVIIKARNQANQWAVGSSGLTSWAYYLQLQDTNAEGTFTAVFNSTAPTDSVITLGTAGVVNYTGNTYIAYLFATVSGVSKVGSYTGTASTLNIDCGFSAGARFVLIKRTDSTGDWYVWDTARGIVSGNDPYLLLNSTAAEVTNTDYIDPYSAGFTVTSSAPAALNASGGSYIFLAIA